MGYGVRPRETYTSRDQLDAALGRTNQKSATAVRRRRPLRVAQPSRIFDFRPRASPSWSLSFHHFATPGTPRGSLTEGHIKVMLAYCCRLSHDYQGFRPFSPGHREAAGPVGPAVARVEVHCKLQTVTSCVLATASTVVMESMNQRNVLLPRNVEVGQAAYGLKGHP